MKKTYISSFFIFCSVLATFSIYFLFNVLISAHHTLKQEKEWISVKTMGRQGLMGSEEFLNLRQTLAKDQLNLGEWHGHNEVFWNQAKKWNSVFFDFKPEKNSYIWIIFSKSKSLRAGFRISLHDKKPSGFYYIDDRGKFLSRKYFNASVKSSWNKVRISKDPNGVHLFLNENLTFSATDFLEDFNIISFRSGIFKVAIDNFKLQQNKEIYYDEFSPRFSIKLLSVSLLFYFSILLFIGIFFVIIFKRKSLFVILVFQFIFLIFISGYYFIDKNMIASAYLFDGFLPFGQQRYSDITLNFEKNRSAFFEKINSFANIHEKKQVLADPLNQFDTKIPFEEWPFMQQILPGGELIYHQSVEDAESLPDEVLKIAFIGTSQTWGAGAQEVKNNFVSQFAFKTIERLKKPVSVFNLSICGVNSSVLINEYNNFLKIWNPNFLIVNLSNNDMGKEESFFKNLHAIATKNKHDKIKTIFVFEATDSELSSPNLTQNHKVMLKVAEEFNIPTINLHGYLASPEIQDSGLNWFDIVHFDQNGHDLTAAWLFENIFPIISKGVRQL